jgi:TM2 domain-containing membrane protein YozV
MYCPKCGQEVSGNPDFCPHCGARLREQTDISSKSRLAVTLLCIIPSFFLINGIHRFYLGKIGTGILMLITFGGLGIWTLIDFIFAVSGVMKDRDGKYISTW